MIGFEQFLKNSNFAPGCTEKIFFGDHVRNENLGKVTKFGYHTITGVDMPEPNRKFSCNIDSDPEVSLRG